MVCTMTVKELFDFITDPNITDDNIDDYLEKVSNCTAKMSNVQIFFKLFVHYDYVFNLLNEDLIYQV